VPFDANQPSRDAGVGVYIDGVYLGRSQGLGAALFDIERIEVLKGPQGTLFGRNSTGGVVSIISKKPTGVFGGRFSAGMHNFDGYNTEAHVDFDEVNDVSVKVGAVVSRRGGTVDNTLVGGEDFNQYDRRGLLIGARWKPSDTLIAQDDLDISKDLTTHYYVQLIEKNPATAPLAPLVQV
jgi:iron complex outermembrane recepter protein